MEVEELLICYQNKMQNIHFVKIDIVDTIKNFLLANFINVIYNTDIEPTNLR